MEKGPPLKIGLLSSGFKTGTGPGTYHAELIRAMTGRHHLFELRSASDKTAQFVHIIDAKRADLRTIGRIAVPVIADFHDDYWISFHRYPCPDQALRRLRQKQLYAHHLKVMERADALIVHSAYVESSLAELIAGLKTKRPAISKPVFNVPYGVELPRSSEGSHPPPAPDRTGGPIILFVGRDMYRKGFGVLLRALPEVIRSAPGARLVAIGDDYFHAKIAARLSARGLPVAFVPEQDRASLAGWYMRASVLVLPSFEEAFGIVLVEAMATGVPVVASRVGGIPEAVSHGESGLLHEPGDPVDLAKKIKDVLFDEGLRKNLIEGGKERARSFSPEKMAQALDRAYRSVARENP